MEQHDHKRSDQGSDGGMNHGMGMMVGCVVPFAAILLLPRFGVSTVVALIIGFGGMIGLHAGMMAFHKLRHRKINSMDNSAHSEHRHHAEV